jgi:hypothetical protein
MIISNNIISYNIISYNIILYHIISHNIVYKIFLDIAAVLGLCDLEKNI